MSIFIQRDPVESALRHGERLNAAGLEAVARVFKLLSEPTRLALLQELKAGPRTVGELVAALGMNQANVSRQLRFLHDAGLVGRRKDGVRVIYSLDEEFLMPLCELVCGKLEKNERQ